MNPINYTCDKCSAPVQKEAGCYRCDCSLVEIAAADRGDAPFPNYWVKDPAFAPGGTVDVTALYRMTPEALEIAIAKCHGWRVEQNGFTHLYELVSPDYSLSAYGRSEAEAWKQAQLPRWARSDTLALQLAEELRQAGWLISIKLMPEGGEFTSNEGDVSLMTPCMIEYEWMRRAEPYRYAVPVFTQGETFALAMCRAYLVLQQFGSAKSIQWSKK